MKLHNQANGPWEECGPVCGLHQLPSNPFFELYTPETWEKLLQTSSVFHYRTSCSVTVLGHLDKAKPEASEHDGC